MGWLSLLAGLLTSVGNLFSSIWSNKTNQQNVNNNNALQIGLAGAANQWSIDQWNRENAYNTPEMQRQRMLAGGFNPAMMMSNGLQSLSGASPAVQMPSTSSAQVQAPYVDPLTSAQIRNLDADSFKKEADAADINATREARIKQIYSFIERNSAEVKDVISKIEQRIHQNALTDAQKDNISFEQMLKQGYLDLDVKRVANETNLTEAQVNKINAEIRETLARAQVTEREYQEMIWTYAIRKAGLEKQNLLTDAKINEANNTASKLKKDGFRLDQVMAIDKPSELRSTSMSNSFQSDNIFTAIAGGTALMVDYLVSKIGGVIIK